MRRFERVVVNPRVCGGQPVIRGLRIPVGLIVRHIAEGQTPAQVVSEYPELEVEDVKEALLFAAWVTRDGCYPLSRQ
jgi:uncharacterized protein (DUF433 family)